VLKVNTSLQRSKKGDKGDSARKKVALRVIHGCSGEREDLADFGF